MNIVKINNKIFKYESFWRNKKTSRMRDFKGSIFPFPKTNIKWNDRISFVDKLTSIQKYLKLSNKYIKYKRKDYKDCIICGEKNIGKGLYELNNIRWEDSLLHYITKHKIKPTVEFIDVIFTHIIGPRVLSRRKAKTKKILITKFNKRFIRLNRNQISIIDALMYHGSKKIYTDGKKKNIYRYSEHVGLLDFDDVELDKIIISGKTSRIDEYDDEIYFPNEMNDSFDYEYIFHTHPPTPKIGGRAKDGILYEFPSISDIFHFIEHYNNGDTQGSIIVAAEGLYIIRKKIFNNKKIKINEERFYRECVKKYQLIQTEAIKKYGVKFSNYKFYSKIAQDKTYINKLNKIFNKYKIHVDYYPREKDNKFWIINTIYLPVYPIEPKKN